MTRTVLTPSTHLRLPHSGIVVPALTWLGIVCGIDYAVAGRILDRMARDPRLSEVVTVA